MSRINEATRSKRHKSTAATAVVDDWLAAELEVASAQQLAVLSPNETTGLRRVS
jgi:hypothetical protein